jgi:glucose-6-phosphate isomerase
LNKFYKGFEDCLSEKELVIELATHLMASVQRGDQSFYFFQYSDQLTQWSLWLQQLLSESLGKKQTRDSKKAPRFPTVVPCRGASDQHSVLQQIIEGPQKDFCCFHRVESSEASINKITQSLFSESLLIGKSPGELLGVEAEATQKAMTESQIPTMVLKTKKIEEDSLGYLMAAWMLSTGVLGEMMNINAFDQPGVESGKSIARRVLSQVN